MTDEQWNRLEELGMLPLASKEMTEIDWSCLYLAVELVVTDDQCSEHVRSTHLRLQDKCEFQMLKLMAEQTEPE